MDGDSKWTEYETQRMFSNADIGDQGDTAAETRFTHMQDALQGVVPASGTLWRISLTLPSGKRDAIAFPCSHGRRHTVRSPEPW